MNICVKFRVFGICPQLAAQRGGDVPCCRVAFKAHWLLISDCQSCVLKGQEGMSAHVINGCKQKNLQTGDRRELERVRGELGDDRVLSVLEIET